MDELAKALNDSDETERIYAAQDIAETNNPDMSIYLIDRLQIENSQAVRDAIVFSLNNLSCSGNYEKIFHLFSSPDPYLRNSTIDIFGSEGNEAIFFLESHMDHADGEVRKLILDALFATGVPDALPAIRKGLHDPSVNVKITAVEYLGRLEDRESIEIMLEIFSNDTEAMLRTAILEMLCQIECRKTDAEDFVSILAPYGDFSLMDPIYLPHMIRLSSKIGDADTLCTLVNTIADINIYAEDIVYAIEQADRIYEEFIKEDCVLEIMEKIMQITENDELRLLCEELMD